MDAEPGAYRRADLRRAARGRVLMSRPILGAAGPVPAWVETAMAPAREPTVEQDQATIARLRRAARRALRQAVEAEAARLAMLAITD